MKKLLSVLIILSLLSIGLFTFGSIDSTNTFHNGSISFNITLESNVNHTHYIDIPLYSNVTNITLNISGDALS